MDNENIGKGPEANDPEILVNDYGATRDQVVVVSEEDRTVLLDDDHTVVMTKEPVIDLPPKNRERKVYGGIWGKTEIAIVAISMLAILTVIVLFVFLVLPQRKQLETARAQRDEVEKQLLSARQKYGKITTTEEQVARLVESVDSFEANFLPVDSVGRTALYQRLNALIASYGLINTTGPDYAPLAMTGEKNSGQQQSEGESGRSKFQSIFPGVYVTMTVEGTYQSLRRFISEVETSDQFVIISAIELEPTEQRQKQEETTPGQPGASNLPVPENPTGVQPGTNPPPRAPKGVTHGEIVSLRLEMAAYFRRPNMDQRTPAEDGRSEQ